MTFTGALTPANSMQVSIMQLGQYIFKDPSKFKIKSRTFCWAWKFYWRPSAEQYLNKFEKQTTTTSSSQA